MIHFFRNFRIIPILLCAAIGLFVLKSLGLVLDGGYILNGFDRGADDVDITGSAERTAADRNAAGPRASKRAPERAPERSWAQQMFGYNEVTGATAGAKPAAPDTAAPKSAAKPPPEDPPPSNKGWTPVPLERPLSPAERALLERLQERRNELDARAKEIEMRENLLKAAEKRLEARVNELKELEARVNDTVNQKDEAEVARFKNVVTMYENMKAKDAAKIFDRLDLKVLVDVSKQINPRRMSDILAQMSPDAAERLTLELARTKDKSQGQAAELPKIEGKPTN
jgi:flagellar motility protein MotE (MotC chaperone)